MIDAWNCAVCTADNPAEPFTGECVACGVAWPSDMRTRTLHQTLMAAFDLSDRALDDLALEILGALNALPPERVIRTLALALCEISALTAKVAAAGLVMEQLIVADHDERIDLGPSLGWVYRVRTMLASQAHDAPVLAMQSAKRGAPS